MLYTDHEAMQPRLDGSADFTVAIRGAFLAHALPTVPLLMLSPTPTAQHHYRHEPSSQIWLRAESCHHIFDSRFRIVPELGKPRQHSAAL